MRRMSESSSLARTTTASPPAAWLPYLILPTQTPPILTVEHVAALLDKTPSAVRALIRKGEIPGGFIGDRYYVVLEDLIALVRSKASR
jgi:hypothetical protein